MDDFDILLQATGGKVEDLPPNNPEFYTQGRLADENEAARIAELPGPVESLMYGLADDVSFGFAENIGSWFSEDGDKFKRDYRAKMQAAEERYPGMNTIGRGVSMVGSVLGGGALLKGAGAVGSRAMRMLASTPGMVASGAASGALHGAGQADDVNVGEAALEGGAIGAGFGLGAKGASMIGSKAIKKLAGGGAAKKVDDVAGEAAVGGAFEGKGIGGRIKNAVDSGKAEERLLDRSIARMVKSGGPSGSKIASDMTTGGASAQKWRDFVRDELLEDAPTAKKFIAATRDPVKMKEALQRRSRVIGEQHGELTAKFDEAINKSGALTVGRVRQTLSDMADDVYKGGISEKQHKEVMKFIDQRLSEADDAVISLEELSGRVGHTTRTKGAPNKVSEATETQEVYRQIDRAIKDLKNNVGKELEANGFLEQGLTDKYREVSRRYAMSQRLLEGVEGGARKEFFSKADGLRIGDQEKNWVGPYEAQQAVRSGDPFQFLGWVIRNSTDRAQDMLDASLVERVRRRGGQRAARIEKMFNEGKNIPKRDEDFMRNLMKASMGANAGGAAARATTDSPKEDPFQTPLALSKIPSAIQTTLAQGVPAGDRKGIEELAQWAASLNYPPSRADVLNQAQKLGISRATAAKIVRKSN